MPAKVNNVGKSTLYWPGRVRVPGTGLGAYYAYVTQLHNFHSAAPGPAAPLDFAFGARAH